MMQTVERMENLRLADEPVVHQQVIAKLMNLQQRRSIAYSSLEQCFGQLRRSAVELPSLMGSQKEQVERNAQDVSDLLQRLAPQIQETCEAATTEFQLVSEEIRELSSALDEIEEDQWCVSYAKKIRQLQVLEKSKLQLVFFCVGFLLF
eukprot:TRINITY_DN2354_c0_g1_i1.p1 TRINITY_DN2354_c0_g1~~TRINITY_DN2354_c0_g1_i1.p1  ORF type:complete len:149 (-),score=43.01 TRINITY_DN2354_c0_g1_i1:36-482(-)